MVYQTVVHLPALGTATIAYWLTALIENEKLKEIKTLINK
jgi:hypothetical protein